MYLLYIDHSGEPADTNERYFVIAGVAVFERQIYFLEQRLNELQSEHLPTETEPVEFHASAMRKHDKPPWDTMPRSERDKLIAAIYDMIARAHSPGLCLFAQAIEKSTVIPDFATLMAQALQNKREAENKAKEARGQEKVKAKQALAQAKQECSTLASRIVARGFEGLCTQFEFFLRRFYDQAEPEHQQRGILILDHASYENEVESLLEAFRLYGTRVSQLYNIIGPPLFTDSRSARLLQVADFVSYAVFRRHESGDTRYLDIVASRFDQSSGVVHGLAHVVSNSSSCMCFACLSRRTARAAP
jgi:hypothetical protein